MFYILCLLVVLLEACGQHGDTSEKEVDNITKVKDIGPAGLYYISIKKALALC